MRRTVLAAVVFALMLCVSAVADVPETMSFQGVLRDNTGTPVPDDTYQIVFSIYPGPLGAPPLWSETQTLYVEGGVVNASIGAVTSLTTLDFLDPYWLGIAIEGEPELTPRTPLETVPYAGHAAFADHTLYGNWENSGDDVYRDVGNVGVGLAPADARLDVVAGDGIAADFSNGSIPSPTVRAANAGGTGATFYSCTAPGAVPVTPAAVYGRGACGARGGHFYASSGDGLYAETTGDYTALVAQAHGTGLAAQFLGDSGIQVQYQADVGSFRMYGGSSPGYVLTSDADGVGTWQPASGSDGDWTVTGGDDMYANPTGYVGIGTTIPAAKLQVETSSATEALHIGHNGAPARVANINRTTTPSAGNDALQIAIPSGSPDGCQLIEAERGGLPVFQVNGNGLIVGSNGASIIDNVEISDGQLLVDYYGSHVGEFTTLDGTASEVLYVEAIDVDGTMDGAAVYGKYAQSSDYGMGGYFKGGWRGVVGEAREIGGTYYHYGVYGSATGSSSNNYGVYGTASGGTNAYAGFFAGNVHVSGTLSATTKTFKIDHPLDPANKYLLHSCVESDEMANVYSGNVTLDAGGKATVELPDWFGALNEDFRYQLTCIGGFAPVYVADKISGNRFSIAGGEPGMEVSWQVTGIRHDPYSVEHRLTVEQDKPAHEVGKYLHPELYGMPKTEAVDYDGERASEVGGGLTERRQLEAFDPSDGE